MTAMPLHRILRRPLATALALLATGATPAPALAATHALRVVASGLSQPKKLTVAPNGDLVVALSGDGVAPASCTGRQHSCASSSGAVVQVTPAGTVTTLRSRLSSVSSGDDKQATGPVQATLTDDGMEVLFQDSTISSTTGAEQFGTEGALLGDLVSYSSTSAAAASVQASLGAFEAKNDPDDGAGSGVEYGADVKIGSDPYSFVAYDGGWAVADAGANDLLFVSAAGAVSVLAVFPTDAEYAAARTFGSKQRTAITAQAQAVPDSVAVGPDGALYVGTLGGSPFQAGRAVVYRVVPGHRPTVHARGFTAIEDITFDAKGRLLVLEIDKNGLTDSGFNSGKPASGEIIRVSRTGARTTLVSSGLSYPTGLAVGADGTIYVTADGVSSDGEILAVAA